MKSLLVQKLEAGKLPPTVDNTVVWVADSDCCTRLYKSVVESWPLTLGVCQRQAASAVEHRV